MTTKPGAAFIGAASESCTHIATRGAAPESLHQRRHEGVTRADGDKSATVGHDVGRLKTLRQSQVMPGISTMGASASYSTTIL